MQLILDGLRSVPFRVDRRRGGRPSDGEYDPPAAGGSAPATPSGRAREPRASHRPTPWPCIRRPVLAPDRFRSYDRMPRAAPAARRRRPTHAEHEAHADKDKPADHRHPVDPVDTDVFRRFGIAAAAGRPTDAQPEACINAGRLAPRCGRKDRLSPGRARRQGMGSRGPRPAHAATSPSRCSGSRCACRGTGPARSCTPSTRPGTPASSSATTPEACSARCSSSIRAGARVKARGSRHSASRASTLARRPARGRSRWASCCRKTGLRRNDHRQRGVQLPVGAAAPRGRREAGQPRSSCLSTYGRMPPWRM